MVEHLSQTDVPVTCSPMLLDDWATTSESDLSPSLSRYMSTTVSKDAALTCPGNVSKDSAIPELWPIKSEATPLFNCVDPMDVSEILMN